MRFEVQGKLKGKDRPRLGKGHTYTTSQTKDYEKAVIISYRLKGGRMLTKSADDPVSLRIIAVHAPNKSDTKKVREQKLLNKIPCTLKPDGDNMLKIVQDALNEVAFHDDRQVVYSEVIKVFGETERLIVDVDVIGGDYGEEIKRLIDSE